MSERIEQKEKRIHSTPWIPYRYYNNYVPRNFAYSAPHWHEEFEISYVASGELDFQINSQKMRLTSGDILIVQPNLLHAVYPFPESPKENHYHTLVFSPSFLACAPGERAFTEILSPLISGARTVSPLVAPTHPYYDEIKMAIENITSFAKNNSALQDIALKGELLCLFFLLLQYEQENDITPPHNLGISHIKLSPAVEYIAKHYDKPIRIKDLADLCFLSSSHFMTQFKQYMGVSTAAYINQIRIQNVCKLLRETTQSVLSIAETCGFRNLSNFDEQFRKLMGCTPSEYRKRAVQSSADKSR